VTRTPQGHAPNGPSRQPVISAHGEMIAFESDASNLLCDRRCARGVRDENLLPDIYLFDRVSGTTRRLSSDSEDQWWDPSVGPSMDGAGRVIAFSSRHPMGSRDIESDFDLFVWRDNVPARRTEQAFGHRNESTHGVTTFRRDREFGGSLCSRCLCCSV
jgi:Tol biopolymer transport system component